LRLRDLSFHSTRIASGAPGEMKLTAQLDGMQPKLALNIDLAAHYRFDAAQRSGELSKLSFKADGDAAGQRALNIKLDSDVIAFDFPGKHVRLTGTTLRAISADGLDASVSVPQMTLSPEQSDVQALSAALKTNQGARKIDARLDLSGLQSQGRKLIFENLNLALDVRQDALALTGKLSSPLLVNLNEQALQLPTLVGDFNISGPNIAAQSVKLDMHGKLQLDWGKEEAHVDLQGRLDGNALALKLGLRQFKQPAIDFVFDADRLDVDRYRTKVPAATTSPANNEATESKHSNTTATAPQAETPIDLSALRTLDARGAVHVGALGVAGLKAQDFKLRLEAKAGRLHLSPITAKLYGGRLSGSVAIDAPRNAFAIQQTAAGVDIGPLLRDLADKDVLEGRGNVAIDLRTNGLTRSALKRALDGSASLALKQGALKGIDLGALLRKAKAVLGSRDAAETTATRGEKTEFSDLSASFVIQNGVAHNDDLLMRSQILRVGGAGDIDIGASTMDYLLKAQVVDGTGPASKELAELRGITVPVRVSGPFDHLKYRPDIRAMAKGAARGQIEKQLEKHLGAKDAEKAGNIADQLLRGLLKKKQ
jgi:AsmA protein